jgi:hypothetical protein
LRIERYEPDVDIPLLAGDDHLARIVESLWTNRHSTQPAIRGINLYRPFLSIPLENPVCVREQKLLAVLQPDGRMHCEPIRLYLGWLPARNQSRIYRLNQNAAIAGRQVTAKGKPSSVIGQRRGRIA